MPRYTLTEIREAVMTALTGDSDLDAWRKKAYRGEVEAYLDGVGDIVGRGKTIYFKWSEGTLDEASQCSFVHRVNFDLVCISEKASGQDKRCEELEALYENVHDTLAGKRLSKQIKQICCAGWRYILQDHAISAMAISFNTLFDYNTILER